MLLVTMMLVKPEGFWPSEVRQRELQGGGEPAESGSRATMGEQTWEVSETAST
jgi:hypothetical protein